jgi:hypothetical protein
MPCYKCANGKWKYGQAGNCQFDTLSACQAAERAIHARENRKNELQTNEETRQEKARQNVMAKKPPHEERERREEPGHKKKPKK